MLRVQRLFVFTLLLYVGVGVVTGVKAQGSKVICIDPGHPSEVNSGYAVQNGTTETFINWKVALILKPLLEAKGFRVVMTKKSERELVKNRRRAEIANAANAALMVRLHCDSAAGSGFALYYPDRFGTKDGKRGPSPDIQKRSRLAAVALEVEMKHLLRGHHQSKGVLGDSKTYIGSKQGALTGSIYSLVPVVTVEMVVLNNPKDAKFIKTAKGQRKMAEAIAVGIEKWANE